VRDGVVVLDGPRITYAGGRAGAPRSDGPDTKVRTIMPGLWDCHAHFLGVRDLDLEKIVREPQALLAARATKTVETVLRAGFTSVREVGGYGIYLAPGVDEGTIAGPTIYAAGAILSQTGGHADIHGCHSRRSPTTARTAERCTCATASPNARRPFASNCARMRASSRYAPRAAC
jgi:imidazolonepropionase-like amidohydrolase